MLSSFSKEGEMSSVFFQPTPKPALLPTTTELVTLQFFPKNPTSAFPQIYNPYPSNLTTQ
jgi:hypothetical protein